MPNLYTASIDVACLPETCTDWKRNHTVTVCSSLARKYWKQVRLSTSCSSIPATHRYLPGGTATLITGNLTGRIVNLGSDQSMGRWSYARLRGHNGNHIFIITAYMVCKTSISTTGPTTAFRQQANILFSEPTVIHPPTPVINFFTTLNS